MYSHDELRQRNRKLRAALTPQQLEQAGEALAQKILALDAYQQAQQVAAYFAVNGEIGLALLDHIEFKHIDIEHACLLDVGGLKTDVLQAPDQGLVVGAGFLVHIEPVAGRGCRTQLTR